MTKPLKLIVLLGLLTPIAISAQSSDKSQSLDNQAASYHRYLDMALNNWCVFFDNGLDPLVYSEETSLDLSNSPYSKKTHKKLLFAALKCEFNDRRITFIEALINNKLVTDRELKNMLKYAAFYTVHKKEFKERHKDYLTILEELVTPKEMSELKDKLKNNYGEMLSFQEIFQP